MESPVLLRQSLGSPLRGKIDGRRHHGQLCAVLSGAKPGSVIAVDFADVADVSASWIAACLVPLMTWVAMPENDIYLVLVGVLGGEQKWEDEFDLVASDAGVVFLATEPGSAQSRLLGSLDPILQDTLRAVQQHCEVTGAGLKRLFPDENIGATAWSNRLKDLHTMRLLKRITRGREQIYSIVTEVNFDGSAGPGIADRHLPATDAT